MSDEETQVKYSLTPQGEAYVEFILANPRADPGDSFGAAWDVQQAKIEELCERLQKATDRVAAVERERNEWGGKASSAQAEASAFRRQRDEVLEALSNLHAAVVQLTNDDPTHYAVANAAGLPALVALQLLERYRPKKATAT